MSVYSYIARHKLRLTQSLKTEVQPVKRQPTFFGQMTKGRALTGNRRFFFQPCIVSDLSY